MTFRLIPPFKGLSLDMLLFLLAAGLSLIFGLMGIMNLTHDSFYVLGAYAAVSVARATGSFLFGLAGPSPSRTKRSRRAGRRRPPSRPTRGPARSISTPRGCCRRVGEGLTREERTMRRTRPSLGTAVALGALACAVAGLPIPDRAEAQKAPIKVGLLYSLTGVYAGPSRDGVNGFKLAFDEVGNAVAGRRVEVIVEDDQAQPPVALTKARKLVEKDRVNVLAGIIWSPNAVAIRDYVHEHKVPLVISEGAARVLTQERRSPYIFRSSFASGQMTHPFGSYACKVLGYNKVAAIGFDSVFGREQADYFEKGCNESGGKVVLEIFPPVETADFGPYLTQVAAAAPDAVWAIWSGAAAIRFHQQYDEFGLKGKFPLIGFGSLVDDAVLRAVGDTALGVVTNYFYVTTLDFPENRRFVQAYRQKYGEEPGIFANGGYTAALVIREAARAVHGEVENAPKFLEAMRRLRMDTPRGPLRFDPYQNPIENVYVQKVERAGGKIANVVIDTLRDVEQYWPKGKPQP